MTAGRSSPLGMRNPVLLASLGVGLSSLIWGIFWIPIRYLGDLGLEGGWAGFALFGAGVVVAIPVALFRLGRLKAGGWGLQFTGLIGGAAFALYATALLLSDIVSVLLLFYLTPVWSTLLGLCFLGERLTWTRCGAIILGFAGLSVIFGIDRGIPLPRNLGDWMALASGMLWAYATLRIHQDKATPAFEQAFVFCLGGAVASGALVMLPFEAVGHVTDPSAWTAALPLLIGFAIIGIWPANLLIMTGARRLSPARVGILLMGEVVMGVSSAALLTDEPFGLRELLGTALVLGAAVLEVSGAPNQRQQALLGARLE